MFIAKFSHVFISIHMSMSCMSYVAKCVIIIVNLIYTAYRYFNQAIRCSRMLNIPLT